MTQKEIIDIERENTCFINLYLEGTFYKAYEQSAFAFCTRIKAYNVLRKESKTLGRGAVPLIEDFLMMNLHLSLNQRKTRVYPSDSGVPFLGAVVCPNGRWKKRARVTPRAE